MERKYNIKIRDSRESFSRWKRNESGRKEAFSSEEVKQYLFDYIKTSSWRLIKAEMRQNSTYCKFLFKPSIDIEKYKDPFEHSDNHVEIKIKPAIGLESILLDKTKNE